MRTSRLALLVAIRSSARLWTWRLTSSAKPLACSESSCSNAPRWASSALASATARCRLTSVRPLASCT